MNSVNVKREDLIKRLEENRANHRATVEEALGNYRTMAIAELDGMIADAKAGKKIRRAVSLIEPQDHTTDYDRVLDMLRMSTDEIIELDQYSFAQYVRDEWEWFGQFSVSNSLYANSVRAKSYLTKQQ